VIIGNNNLAITMSSPFVTNVYSCKAKWRMEKTSPGLCPSKETPVWTFIATSDYDVTNLQFVNVMMFNDLEFRDRCRCFVGVLPRSCVYCGCHRKTSAGALFLSSNKCY